MTTPVLRGSTAPVPGRPDGTPFGQNTLQATSPDSTLVGDLILCVSWHGTPSVTVSALTLRSGEGWTQLFNFLHDDGSFDGSFGAAWKIATQAGAQVYQAFNTTSPATDCRTALRVYQIGTFDSSGILSATPVSFIDGNVAPDPATVSGLNAARDYLIEAIGGWWHNQDLVVCTPGAPAGYGNLIETSAGGWLELALVNKAVSGVTSENPGVFTDNVSSTNNSGSVGVTIAILGAAGTTRQAIVTQAELEIPEAAPQRRTIITQAEFEVPNKKLPDTLTFLFHRHWAKYRVQSEDPQPVTPRRALVTQAELEVPDLGRRSIITWSELEVPNAPLPSGLIYGSWLPGITTFYIDQHNTWLGNAARLRIIPAGTTWSTSTGTWNTVWAAQASSIPFIASYLAPWLAANPNRKIMLNVPLAARSTAQGRQPLERVGQGLDGVDAGVEALADAMMAYGMEDAIIRLGQEFDGNWFNWGILNPGTGSVPATNGPTTFKAAWQRVHDKMTQRQPTNQWDWCLEPCEGPAHSPNLATWLASVWPGDTYVDSLGIDIYDKWGSGYPVTSADISSGAAVTKWNNAWNNKFKPFLDTCSTFANAHGKPMSFPEWAVWWDKRSSTDPNFQPGGNDNPSFIQHMHDWMKDPAHNVAWQIYFNVNPPSQTVICHRLNPAEPPTSLFPFPNAAEKFIELFQNS